MGGSAVRLVRQIPYTIACDLLLTGRHITAAEAKEYGLIGYVVPDGTALDKALEIAEVINNNGPLAVQAILKTIRETEGMHEEEAFKPDTANGIRGVPERRRQGRPAGVQGEAVPELQDALTRTPVPSSNVRPLRDFGQFLAMVARSVRCRWPAAHFIHGGAVHRQ